MTPSANELNLGALLLAAGTSSRFGVENKLLANFKGKSLIRHVAELVTNMEVFCETVAITGYDSSNIEHELRSCDIPCVFNSDFETGLASSVKLGVSTLDKCDAVMVLPCDMPYINAATITTMINALAGRQHNLETAILVASNNGKRGNPVILLRSTYEDVMKISGDSGAKQLFPIYQTRILNVEINNKGIHHDIDYPDDLTSH